MLHKNIFGTFKDLYRCTILQNVSLSRHQHRNFRRIGTIVREKYLLENYSGEYSETFWTFSCGPFYISIKGVQARILQSFRRIGGIMKDLCLRRHAMACFPSRPLCRESGAGDRTFGAVSEDFFLVFF